MGYKGYRNYQRNEMIKELNTNLIFSDPNSKFKKHTYSDSEYELNNSLLNSISRIKDSITSEFLNRTKEKILFFGLDKDTLKIKMSKELKITYSSSLDKGVYDKDFNEFLVESLKSLLSEHQIEQIEIYTLTPTKYENITPPSGTLANFEY